MMRSQQSPYLRARRRRPKQEAARPPSPDKLEEREKGWDDTPYRCTPAALKGMHLNSREPWAADADQFVRVDDARRHLLIGHVKSTGKHGIPSKDERPFSQRYLQDVFNRHHDKQQTKVTAKAAVLRLNRETQMPPEHLQGQPSWNSSAYHHVPFTCKGVQSVRREPWDHDRAIRNHNAQRVGVGPGCLDVPQNSSDPLFTDYDLRMVECDEAFYTATMEKWATALSA